MRKWKLNNKPGFYIEKDNMGHYTLIGDDGTKSPASLRDVNFYDSELVGDVETIVPDRTVKEVKTEQKKSTKITKETNKKVKKKKVVNVLKGRVTPKNMIGRIKDFTEDILDDGKRNYSNREPKSKK